MISINVSVRIDQAELRRVTRRAGIKLIDEVTDEVADRARRLAPRGRGALRASIRRVRAKPLGLDLVKGAVEATARHAVWVHEGTGIYGPRHDEIEPRNDEVLRFPVGGRIVWAQQVRGVRPTKFLTRAMLETLSEPPWKIVWFTRPLP